MHDLRARDPFARITAAAVRALLPVEFRDRTDSGLRVHMRAIHREARRDVIDTPSIYSEEPSGNY
jgi:hypothetical protein